jgi:hypothetical protein
MSSSASSLTVSLQFGHYKEEKKQRMRREKKRERRGEKRRGVVP